MAIIRIPHGSSTIVIGAGVVPEGRAAAPDAPPAPAAPAAPPLRVAVAETPPRVVAAATSPDPAKWWSKGSWWWSVAALVAVAIVWWIAVAINAYVSPPALVLRDGMSAFALLYIAAQIIERLLEPFSERVGDKQTPAKDRDQAIASAHNAVANDDRETATREVTTAAENQAEVDAVARLRTYALWATASSLGLLASAGFGIYLLAAVLAPSAAGAKSAIEPWIDILITGLAIGSGTKPLHDLIKNIQGSKDQRQSPPESQPSAL